VARPAETLEAINDLLASATIFTSISSDLLAVALRDLAGDRLTFAQLKLLRLVTRQDLLSVGDVAAFLGISNAAASKAVDRLVRAGLLQRAEAEGNRRTTEVSVTGEGRALLGSFEARSNTALLGLLAGASLRQMREIAGGLDRLSLSMAERIDAGSEVCFRCGLYFRDDCLLRTLPNRRCYLHLGSRRRTTEAPGTDRREATRNRQVVMTTEGDG
jgi:DNA-binding MarR family transcriptional regulator